MKTSAHHSIFVLPVVFRQMQKAVSTGRFDVEERSRSGGSWATDRDMGASVHTSASARIFSETEYGGPSTVVFDDRLRTGCDRRGVTVSCGRLHLYSVLRPQLGKFSSRFGVLAMSTTFVPLISITQMSLLRFVRDQHPPLGWLTPPAESG